MNGVKKSKSWKGKSYVIFFKCEMIICVELCVWSGPELRCLLSWYQLYWFTGSVQQEQECGPCTKRHTHQSFHRPKKNPSADQTSPKETSLCLMCACLWMNVLKCLELKCTRRAGSQAQIKQSPTIKRISREKDQSSCDVTWSHLNDLRTVLKINYLLVIWIICLLSVWLLICMRKQKCLLGKLIIISLKEF